MKLKHKIILAIVAIIVSVTSFAFFYPQFMKLEYQDQAILKEAK